MNKTPPNAAWNSYQQSEILDAAPTRLVILLYRGAIDAVTRARAHQLKGECRERSVQITRAFEILAELAHSVDREKGGELAVRLLQLYDYMQQQLNEANIEQITEPLDEVAALLGNLLEGWEGAHAELAVKSTAMPAVQVPGAAYAQPERNAISYSV